MTSRCKFFFSFFLSFPFLSLSLSPSSLFFVVVLSSNIPKHFRFLLSIIIQGPTIITPSKAQWLPAPAQNQHAVSMAANFFVREKKKSSRLKDVKRQRKIVTEIERWTIFYYLGRSCGRLSKCVWQLRNNTLLE